MFRIPFLVAGLFATFSLQAADFYKGITISAQTWGKEWATPAMAAALDEVKGLGADSIAIHPYARIQADGGLKFSDDPDPDYIAKPLDWARERGLRVMLVPHIAYWGSPWLWRGDIDFTKVEEWRRFFNDYERWMTAMARIAEKHGAQVLCVGLEYSHAVKFEGRWRAIIDRARHEFHGRLVYGANWDTIDDVSFWDALDYIGVLAYFPLTNAQDPTSAQITDGWKPWLEKLRTLSQRYAKPVLFTEIGYNESELCAAQPWDFHHSGSSHAAEIQSRCVEQALQLHAPWFAGMFWWKWFPDLPEPEHETFDMRRPALKSLLGRYWGEQNAKAH